MRTTMKGLMTVALVLALAPAAEAGGKKGVDRSALADRLVTQTAGVKEGESVQIVGNPADVDFLEDLAVAARKVGAQPFITVWSDRAAQAAIAGVPAKYDTQAPKLETALNGIVNVRIVVPPVRDPGTFAKLPADRRAVQSKAMAAADEVGRKKGVRLVELSNGLFPTAIRAKELGVSEGALAKLYWDGLGADYAAVQERAKTLKATLAAGSELHITTPNGTDLKVKVTKRPVQVSDGVISADDMKAGWPAIAAWLPAGEVYLVPVPGTAEGKVVSDREVHQGKEVKEVFAEFKAGKVTHVGAKSGWDVVKPDYDAAGPRKVEFGFVDFGINPALKASGKMKPWAAAGVVTVGIGENAWAGGDNTDPGGFIFQLAGATVTLDGKPLVEKGVLK